MTNTADPGVRQSRVCAKCGIEDTHAHHTQYVAFNHPVTGEGTDLSVTKHIQCCAEDGCPICAVDVAGMPSTAPSDEFTAYMVDKPAAVLEQLATTQDISLPADDIPQATPQEGTT